MKSGLKTVEQYIEELAEDRKLAIEKLRTVILKSMPKELQEEISYGMIGYVIPHSVYPKGYHVNRDLPLPFMNLASQKQYIALYHMGLYQDKELLHWFQNEYPKHSKYKLDMGKSCVRFKKLEDIPYNLIKTLLEKLSVKEYIRNYESVLESVKSKK